MNSKIYKQMDSRWSSKPYPRKGSSFGGNGCGCCACTHIAIEQEAKKNWTPENLRPWMINQGFAVYGQGTTWNGITETLKHIGHKNVVRVWSDPMSVAWKELNKGNRIGIILFGSGRGPDGTVWTAGGHYVAFTDYKLKDGKHWFYCKDSGGRDHDGWYSYEKSMKGCIPKMWIVEKLGKAPSKGKYTGTLPTTKLVKTNAQVKADAIAWAKWIAGDNRFHYGHGKHAHHNGCYFCGTQKLKKGHGIKNPDFTYCCNPFVGAAWAHGGGDATALNMCKKCNSWDFGTGDGSYHKSRLFNNLGHPAKDKLKAGDVLCNSSHVVLYIGDGKIAEASGGDDNVPNSKSWDNSIHVTALTDSRYKGLPRAYRYNGNVNVTRPLEVGEISDRALLLKKFLIWYGYKLNANRIFSDNTEKAVKLFQKATGLKVDGVVGDKTIAKMKEVKK